MGYFLQDTNFFFLCFLTFILFAFLGVFCSGSKSALVTNTTVDIMVPEHVMGAVYGENGSNLGRIRQVFHSNHLVTTLFYPNWFLW